MTKKTRVLLADDHEVVRRGLRVVLEAKGDLEVCGEATTGREAVEKARELKPDVVVLDISMPELNGLDATTRILKLVPGAEVLILTMHESEGLIRSVLEAGARGFMLKSDAGRDLVQAVDSLSRHKPFFTSKVAQMILEGFRHRKGGTVEESVTPQHLTTREREIVQLVAEGKSSKEIANSLGISVKTAETHRSNVMRKLNFHSVSDIVRYAVRNKLIEP